MTAVKICGLSTPETMAAALDAGADMVGLVFYPRSPRHVTLDQAARLAGQARGRASIVALTVDASDEDLRAITTAVEPDFIQAHGAETPVRVAAIHDLTGLPVIKAIKVHDAADVAQAAAFSAAAFLILYDAKAPETLTGALPGGNGLAFDWNLLGHGHSLRRFMLSGGLTPSNVVKAIRATEAPIVDVSSGVESAPGIKDVALIRKFIEQVQREG